MASHSQTQSDLIAGSVPVSSTMNDISLGLSPPRAPTHNITDGQVPFHSLPRQVFPMQVGDLNIPFDPFAQNDSPPFNYHITNFPGISFGCELPRVGNSLPRLDSASAANLVNFSHARSGFENFHRTPSNFRDSGFSRLISNASSEPCENQARVNAPQINNFDRLDGRFLSLGFQSNPSVSTNSTALRGMPSHMCESPHTHLRQLGNYPHDNFGGRLGGFQNNVRDLGTPLNISGNFNMVQSNHREFQGMTSIFGVPPVPILPRGQANTQHFMPTPRMKIPEHKIETEPRISSSVPFERGMQSAPFNSSVLRSNRQNAADPLQMSYIRNNEGLPLPVEIGGGFVRQDNTDRGATMSWKNQSGHSSTAIAREPLKRNLDSPQHAMMNQRRRVPDQSSSHLLQNALGQVTAEAPTNMTKMPERPSTPQAAFIPPTHFSKISEGFSGPTAFANTPSISMASPAGPTPTPAPTYAHTNLTHRRTRLPSRKVATPSPSGLRNVPHVLSTSAKSSQPYAALQSPPRPPHIKRRVSDTRPTHGFKCGLCNRDLAYAPEGPIRIPPIPEPVAVLPCGHTFHDQCLRRITPDNQSRDPPCIPCAVPDL